MTTLVLLTSFGFAQTFEQNGVKDGNIKLSASLYTQQPTDGDDNVNFNGQVGYFLNDNIEVLLGLNAETRQEEIYYTLSPGVNYYFYKTPIFTPYIGGQFYYWNTSFEYIKEEKGSTLYLGTHAFISENIAISPEFGTNFVDFESNQGTYFNTFLTYFF